MSLNSIPSEIFQLIFSYLTSADIQACHDAAPQFAPPSLPTLWRRLRVQMPMSRSLEDVETSRQYYKSEMIRDAVGSLKWLELNADKLVPERRATEFEDMVDQGLLNNAIQSVSALILEVREVSLESSTFECIATEIQAGWMPSLRLFKVILRDAWAEGQEKRYRLLRRLLSSLTDCERSLHLGHVPPRLVHLLSTSVQELTLERLNWRSVKKLPNNVRRLTVIGAGENFWHECAHILPDTDSYELTIIHMEVRCRDFVDWVPSNVTSLRLHEVIPKHLRDEGWELTLGISEIKTYPCQVRRLEIFGWDSRIMLNMEPALLTTLHIHCAPRYSVHYSAGVFRAPNLKHLIIENYEEAYSMPVIYIALDEIQRNLESLVLINSTGCWSRPENEYLRRAIARSKVVVIKGSYSINASLADDMLVVGEVLFYETKNRIQEVWIADCPMVRGSSKLTNITVGGLDISNVRYVDPESLKSQYYQIVAKHGLQYNAWHRALMRQGRSGTPL